MPPFSFLVRSVGQGVLKASVKTLIRMVPGGDFSLDVAKHVMSDVKAQEKENEFKRQLQAVARASAQEVAAHVAVVVHEIAAEQTAEIQQALTAYLSELPTATRRMLQRRADPSGTTLPEALDLRTAEDFLPFLPKRPPRFRAGDRPKGIGDWELVERLGAGAFGEVWKARNPHRPNAAPVALKFCLNPTAAKQLRNEVTVLDTVMAQGKHPGIVELLGTHFDADPPCLEYEYVEGYELSKLIQPLPGERPTTTPKDAALVVLQLCEIIGYAHRLSPAIVHRDLKPANILIQQSSNGSVRLRVADFGIGSLAASQAISEAAIGTSRQDVLLGACTPLYASPQQMRGDVPDPRDDVHALGVIWYQLLTADITKGRPGGSGWYRRLVHKGVPAAQLDLIQTCIEDDPADRPTDLQEVAARLRAIMGKSATRTAGRSLLWVVWEFVVASFSGSPHRSATGPASGQSTGLPAGHELPPLVRNTNEHANQPVHRTTAEAAMPHHSGATEGGGWSGILTDELKRTVKEVHLAHERANKLSDDHDYDGAVRALESLPAHLRNDDFLTLVRRNAENVRTLQSFIHCCVRTKHFFGLRYAIVHLLRLRPGDTDLQEMLAALPPDPPPPFADEEANFVVECSSCRKMNTAPVSHYHRGGRCVYCSSDINHGVVTMSPS